MKPIENFKDYFIDKNGDVYSTKLGYLHKLKTRANRYGYLVATLSKNGKSYYRTVHKLVVSAYIRVPDLEKDETVNHKDGNKLNNHLDNLEIISRGDNVRHSRRNKLQPCKYSDKIIIKALTDIHNGKSTNSVAKQYGISQSYLNKIKKGIYRKDVNVKIGSND